MGFAGVVGTAAETVGVAVAAGVIVVVGEGVAVNVTVAVGVAFAAAMAVDVIFVMTVAALVALGVVSTVGDTAAGVTFAGTFDPAVGVAFAGAFRSFVNDALVGVDAAVFGLTVVLLARGVGVRAACRDTRFDVSFTRLLSAFRIVGVGDGFFAASAGPASVKASVRLPSSALARRIRAARKPVPERTPGAR